MISAYKLGVQLTANPLKTVIWFSFQAACACKLLAAASVRVVLWRNRKTNFLAFLCQKHIYPCQGNFWGKKSCPTILCKIFPPLDEDSRSSFKPSAECYRAKTLEQKDCYIGHSYRFITKQFSWNSSKRVYWPSCCYVVRNSRYPVTTVEQSLNLEMPSNVALFPPRQKRETVGFDLFLESFKGVPRLL